MNLTVIDDDGFESTASVTVTVNEEASDGLLGFSATGALSIALFVVIVLLVAVLLIVNFARGKSDSTEYQETGFVESWNEPQPMYGQVAQSDPMATQTYQEVPTTGPPIPASGIPDGWTMEQWNYYGAQYLADNPPAAAQPPVYNPEPAQTYQPQPVYEPAPAQTFENPAPTQVSTPMVQEPAPTPASQALANLLDDLDL